MNNIMFGWLVGHFTKEPNLIFETAPKTNDCDCVEMKSEKCAFSSCLTVRKYLLVLFRWSNWFCVCTWLSTVHRCMHVIFGEVDHFLQKLQVLKRFMLIIYYDQSQYFNNDLIEFFEEFETLEKCYAKWPWKLECT